MRLDTAILVAPKPVVPSMPTRRAFLMTGSAFIAGASIGGACGYAAASRNADESSATTEPLDTAAGLVPTGDKDLDALRRLALAASVDELAGNHIMFLDQVRTTYYVDEFLWHGVERMAEAVIAGTHRGWPRGARGDLEQLIAGLDARRAPRNAVRLRARLGEIRRVR